MTILHLSNDENKYMGLRQIIENTEKTKKTFSQMTILHLSNDENKYTGLRQIIENAEKTLITFRWCF